MYRLVETGTWDDPKVHELYPEAKLLFIYLFTNRYGHLSGIYYLPDTTILYELGAKKNKVCRYPIDTLWDTLSGAGLVWRDKKNQVVFVKSMFKYQGQGEKHYRSAATHIKTLHRTGLINRFIEVYPKIKEFGVDTLSGYPIVYPIDTPSAPRPKETGTGTGNRNRKQEINTSARSDSEESSLQVEIFTELPCNGKKNNFQITKEYIAQMKPLFPGLDLEKEILKAKAWLINNPKRRKTYSGMTSFLNRWFDRAQDKHQSISNDAHQRSLEAKQRFIDRGKLYENQ